MPGDKRGWLLQHLDEQARYLRALTTYAAEHPDDPDVLLRVRSEVFTLRETLETLGVPHATVSNAEWRSVPTPDHRPEWPTAADAALERPRPRPPRHRESS